MKLDKATVKKICFLIAVAMLLLLIVINFETAIDILGYIVGLLMPLIIGCCMAFILNVLMKFIENRVLIRLGDGKLRRKLRRPVSLLLTLIVVLGILAFVLAMIIPTLKDTISTLLTKTPDYLTLSVNGFPNTRSGSASRMRSRTYSAAAGTASSREFGRSCPARAPSWRRTSRAWLRACSAA
jgi:predicted PurR-regulated permease PerM